MFVFHVIIKVGVLEYCAHVEEKSLCSKVMSSTDMRQYWVDCHELKVTNETSNHVDADPPQEGEIP